MVTRRRRHAFMMIVFALIGLIVCAQYIIRRLKIRKQRSLEKENQTEPARPVWLPKVTTKDIGIQTEGSAIPVKAGSSPKRMEAQASCKQRPTGKQYWPWTGWNHNIAKGSCNVTVKRPTQCKRLSVADWKRCEVPQRNLWGPKGP